MAINTILNINLSTQVYIVQLLILTTMVIYFTLLVFDTLNYLKIIIFFELLILMITVIFLSNIYESIDHIVFLLLVMVGAESGLALSIIFPFLIK